jgi:hypothetical protein
MHEAKPSPAPLLTVTMKGAMRATGLGRTKLNELLKTGRLRRVKVDKRTLSPFEDLQKLTAPPDDAA